MCDPTGSWFQKSTKEHFGGTQGKKKNKINEQTEQKQTHKTENKLVVAR